MEVCQLKQEMEACAKEKDEDLEKARWVQLAIFSRVLATLYPGLSLSLSVRLYVILSVPHS